MRRRFLHRFSRITYSTSYLPEIDGLRFLAIFMVVVIMHIPNYLDAAFFQQRVLGHSYWKDFSIQGGNGVALFFMISGFILSLPFAKWRLRSEAKVSLKRYYLRRLTRLEPPYLVALLLLFAAQVWVLHQYTFPVLLPHLLASAAYLHGCIYHAFSWVMPVAWSLEVEVQFYLAAPVLFLIFLVDKPLVRRAVLILAMLVFALLQNGDAWKGVHLLLHLHYFLGGILLADLYCTGRVLFAREGAGLAAGLVSLIAFIGLSSFGPWPVFLLKLASMFILFHTVLTNRRMKKLFSIKGLTIIGGMCYSIYLLHFALISAAGFLLSRLSANPVNSAFFFPLLMLMAAMVLFASAIYFLLIEKPFMRLPARHKKKK